MSFSSTKPYLIRAIYQWCIDNDLTAYVCVLIDQNTSLPEEFKREGEITLNISPKAVHHLLLENNFIQFTTRFNGIPRKLTIPISAIKAIFAKENNHGLFFAPEIEQKTSQILKDEEKDIRESRTNNESALENSRNRDHLKIVR